MPSPPCAPLPLTAHSVVAYHFCQADNAPTCLPPEFVHSLSAQLSQAPQLSSYYHLLQTEPSLLAHLSLASCTASPSQALVRGILEPLTTIEQPGGPCVIVVDGLCEAEQHKPDHGDTMACFLSRHLPHFPPWLKLVCTVRTSQEQVVEGIGLHRIR